MTLDRRHLLAAGLALPLAAGAARAAAPTRPADVAPDASLALWPEGHLAVPPGLVERVVQRSDDPQASDRMLEHIVRPRLDIFRPANPNGAAVVLAPGGGELALRTFTNFGTIRLTSEGALTTLKADGIVRLGGGGTTKLGQ